MVADQISGILNAMPFACLLLSQDSVVVWSNAAANDLLGADLRGQGFGLVFRHPEVLAALSEATRDAKRTNARAQSRTLGGKSFEFDFSPLGNAAGEEELILAVCRDVTREEQVERMRSDFVANASHELRTPLATLSGFIETMQGPAKQDEKARDEFLKLMKAQADRMAGLIGDLLSLSRIELDEHLEPRGVVDVGQIIKQTESLLRPLATEMGCALEVDSSANLKVRGDSGQLGQVMNNLIENAIKYSGSGKRVSVRCSQKGPAVVITVADNGPGIAAHHIPRLTERFYRVNVQDSRTRGGTGLGLAICKHIVNRHRGRLVIESKVGTGSTFTVLLPVEKK